MTVYYEILVNSTEKDHLKSFVVVFGSTTFDSNGFDPSVVVPLMQQCIDNTWRLRINKTTYMFSASFDEYTNYVQDGQQLKSKYSVDDVSFILQNKPEPAVFERISSNLYFTTNSGGIWLRKTFFCKQVCKYLYRTSSFFMIRKAILFYATYNRPKVRIRVKDFAVFLSYYHRVKDVKQYFLSCLH